ncbi:MAG: MATE family efflux transporter, partial [Oscillospiraceae bacterium]|nr:MATE family efflux transporter [Oscillospiraceae bacterium]
MAKDLTRGNPLRIILLFSIPLAIGNACNQLYSMVDSMIVGRWCGPDKLAAVGNAGSVIFMLLGFFWGLPAGFTIITGQRFGAKDAVGVRRSFCASVVLCSALVAAVTLVFLAYLRPILVAMNTPENILADSLRYLRIIVVGTPSMTFYLLMSFLMRALGDSRRPL